MFTRISLQKQLIVIFSAIAIMILFVFLPLIDHNLSAVIDDEMYDILDRSLEDFYSYHFSPVYGESDKQIYHFTYNITTDTLYLSQNISPKKERELTLAFSEQLYKMIDKDQVSARNKVKLNDQTIYYQIKKVNSSKYIVSLVYSDYSKNLIKNLNEQIIYIFYGILLIVAALLFLWVSSLIKPLKQIRGYINDIKNDRESTLHIKRKDEIGILSSSLVEMKEEIDRQNEIKEEMIHNISHDLKTPIAIIQSYAQSIKDDVYPYGDKDSSVDVILENSNRLEKKVRSLLYLNRLDYYSEHIGDDTCHMKQLIEHLVMQMQSLHQDIKIVTELEDVEFKGLEDHWRICIENIIENAFRYVKSEIKIILQENFLEIFNDGEPIDVENPDLLFQPYETGNKGQFGLGLSIVYKTVTMYGYKVSAVNKENGVSFIITKNKNKD